MTTGVTLGAFAAAPLRLLGTAVLLGVMACSSSSTTPSNPGQSSSGGGSGDDGGSGMTTSGDTNPDGVPYPAPAAGYGRTARMGNTPGSVIQDFKFLGYPNSDKTNGLQTVALADYYDPCNKRAKLLHIIVSAVWCIPCNDETDALVAAQADLASKGVVVLQALDDGPVKGMDATKGDLDYWVQNHKTNFTVVLDPGLQNFAGFFDADAIPWNADIDPRTMEIISESLGWAGDVDTELQPALSSLPAQPSYPIPSGACP